MEYREEGEPIGRCPTCKGQERITVTEQIEGYAAEIDYIVECPDCEGTGLQL